MEKIQLVAVYGSLRKGLGNSRLLEGSKYVGEFDTKPEYDLYSVGGAYPGMVKDGSTSIKMEVYEVNEYTANRLDILESYQPGNESENHYNKIRIETPFGEANTYIYNYPTQRLVKVESGDWLSFKKQQEEWLLSRNKK